MPDAGVIIAIVLGLLFVWVLYWSMVLVPRRHRQFYDSLRPAGFLPLTKENEKHVEARLRDLFPVQVEGRSPYSLPRVAVKIGGGATATRISGEQFLLRTTMYYGVAQKNTPVICSTVFLESASLPIDGDFYVVAHMFGKKGEIRQGGDLHEITQGISDDFARNYTVLSPENTIFPESLQRMLADSASLLVTQKAASDAIYVKHFRFNRTGWSFEALDMTDVAMLQKFHAMAVGLSEKTAAALV